MNLKTLLSNVPDTWMDNYRQLKSAPKLKKFTAFVSDNIPYFRLIFTVEGMTDKYITELAIPIKPAAIKSVKKVFELDKVRVYCSCPAFKYYVAYALKTKGSLHDHKKDLGIAYTTPAKVRNPGNVPYVCKHLVKVADLLTKQTVLKLISQ